MKDDVRYSELLFLQTLENRSFPCFYPSDPRQTKAVGLNSDMYVEMAVALLEDLLIRFHDDAKQILVGRLRGEVGITLPSHLTNNEWANPRDAIWRSLIGPSLQELRITYRGLRRIEELRETLRRDRILDDFGVLLSVRYVYRDLQDAINRATDISVSVLRLDMDDFGSINKKFGHDAGNVVMEAYLKTVRDCLGLLGAGYRGVGDEVVALIIGQGHEKATELAESIRTNVEAMQCTHKKIDLPKVTASIGVATTPPASRTMELETLAEERQRKAKERGKNHVVAA